MQEGTEIQVQDKAGDGVKVKNFVDKPPIFGDNGNHEIHSKTFRKPD
jgi:hypothetical protein